MANPALVGLLGFSSFEELQSRNLEKEGYSNGLSRSEFKRRIENYGEVKNLEAKWLKFDGTVAHVRESAKAVQNPEGKVVYYEGIVEDISKHRQLEEERSRASRLESLGGLFPAIGAR